MQRLLEFVDAFKSIFIGMRITMKWSRKKEVTALYPYTKPVFPERFRGTPQLRALAGGLYRTETVSGGPLQFNSMLKNIIDKDKLPTCSHACPAHVDIRGYIGLFAEGRNNEALELIRERCPMPASIGRVCTQPCEAGCRRSHFDQPISIRDIKRYIADACRDNPNHGAIPKTKQQSIGIVGAGPAGLTAAQDLAKLGFNVTIYDKNPHGGGTLLTGIPSYRLPKDILQWDVDAILALGVELRCDTKIGTDISFDELCNQHDAILIATGLPAGWNLGVDEEDAEGVWGCLDLLRAVNFGERPHLGANVAVVGGGNVAMDGARSARRLGAQKVYLIYRRSMAEMPARKEEIHEALEEGITFELLANPTRVISEDGKVSAIECVKMGLGEPDSSGRRRPEPIPGSEFILKVDSVIVAIGQKIDLDFLSESSIERNEKGAIVFNKQTLQTSDPKVFAAGEVVTGAGAAIEAIANGHEAAESITRYLMNQDLSENRTFQITPYAEKIQKSEPDSDCIDAYVSSIEKERMRPQMNAIPLAERLGGFDEVELGLSSMNAIAEANRCLSCDSGVCSGCTICARTCPAFCIDVMVAGRDEGKKQVFHSIDISKCMFCGYCAEACPTGALHMSHGYENSQLQMNALLINNESTVV